MQIEWFGHSCFLIKNCIGKRILIDPYDATFGYSPFKGNVDIVTVSHKHFDHFDKDRDWNECTLIDSLGTNIFSFCTIKSFLSYHDNLNGALRGDNLIFLYELDGFRLCHLGDLGHPLTECTLELLKDIDVLFIPVGGNYTIDGLLASKITKQISPTYVVPMHYKTPYTSFLLDGPEKFITSMNCAQKLSANSFTLDEKQNFKNKVLLFSINNLE